MHIAIRSCQCKMLQLMCQAPVINNLHYCVYSQVNKHTQEDGWKVLGSGWNMEEKANCMHGIIAQSWCIGMQAHGLVFSKKNKSCVGLIRSCLPPQGPQHEARQIQRPVPAVGKPVLSDPSTGMAAGIASWSTYNQSAREEDRGCARYQRSFICQLVKLHGTGLRHYLRGPGCGLQRSLSQRLA